jgi:hypothetical protein
LKAGLRLRGVRYEEVDAEKLKCIGERLLSIQKIRGIVDTLSSYLEVNRIFQGSLGNASKMGQRRW